MARSWRGIVDRARAIPEPYERRERFPRDGALTFHRPRAVDKRVEISGGSGINRLLKEGTKVDAVLIGLGRRRGLRGGRFRKFQSLQDFFSGLFAGLRRLK